VTKDRRSEIGVLLDEKLGYILANVQAFSDRIRSLQLLRLKLSLCSLGTREIVQ
jgi:hypothetical protein